MSTWFVSGYKSFELGIFKRDAIEVFYIQKAIRNILLQKIDEGLEWVLISGQLGVELWAAETVFALQDEGFDVKLAVIQPFLEMESRWKEGNQEWFHEVIANADYHNAVFHESYKGAHQLRRHHQFVLDHTEGAILLYDVEREGSPRFFLEAARFEATTVSYPIEMITFDDLQNVVEEDEQTFD
ncbi:DUF1273 domain-containing protein [Bacillus fonticola]|uniref:DUF1273 domain-containing protein n=1 Tax=Bacillus fonticola TaxID=2728853 RepID=UPI001475A5EB|nr:DUF1273 domain-containing protein [Bacillus fonticola]